MIEYLEFDFKIKPIIPWSEILIAHLIELGFDSFMENSEGFLAYVTKNKFDKEKLESLYKIHFHDVEISYTFKEMPNINWNEEWEKNFSPINVENKVYIRAEFHSPKKMEHEIVIHPKMSFGTGHHATTYLMIQQMIDIDFTNKKVLDMGCGTSILGIYAKKRGAKDVLGIDIDEWAVENSVENANLNNTYIRVDKGTAENLGQEKFDIILANINRNILISDIPKYVEVLEKDGLLLLSGLCFFDVDDILQVCEEQGLVLNEKLQREEWVSLLLAKQ